MAHELSIRADGSAEMFSVRETPWHALGTVLKTAPKTSEEAIVEAGQDWEVHKCPLSAMTEDGTFDYVPTHVLMRRSDNGRQLAVMSKDYEIVQNREAFSFFDPIVAAGDATYETAGVLRDGKVTWIMARLTEQFKVGHSDVIQPYVLLTNSFDGTQALHVRFTPIRVVCANTLGMALRMAASKSWTDDVNDPKRKLLAHDTAISIRHVKNARERLDEARNVLGLVRDQMSTTQQAYELIAKARADAAMVDRFLENVFPLNPLAEYHGVTEKKRREVRELFEGKGLGADREEAAGTLWGLYNATTELVDYGAVVQGAAAKNKASRVNSMFNGAGLKLKQRALATAVALAGG